MITDYASLKTAVANWANRDDLATVLPDLVQLGENGMYKKLRALINEVAIVGTTSMTEISLPSDYEEMNLVLVDGMPLERVSLQKLATFTAGANLACQPRMWARRERNVVLWPNQIDLPYELHYWRRFPALSDAEPVNTALTAAPELFLWFTLVEVAAFLGNDTQGAVWSAQAARAIEAHNSAWHGEAGSGSTQHVSTVGNLYGS